MKIKLDLRKPLLRGRILHVNGRSLWIGFKCEKLQRFCYKCGVILHGRQGCRGQVAPATLNMRLMASGYMLLILPEETKEICHTDNIPMIVGWEGISAMSNRRTMKGFLQMKVLAAKKKVILAGVLGLDEVFRSSVRFEDVH